ncbi:MAG: hypothetical protein ACO2PN_07060 [Pyrobaculum sp.]
MGGLGAVCPHLSRYFDRGVDPQLNPRRGLQLRFVDLAGVEGDLVPPGSAACGQLDGEAPAADVTPELSLLAGQEDMRLVGVGLGLRGVRHRNVYAGYGDLPRRGYRGGVGQGGRKGEEERGHHLQHGAYLYSRKAVRALPEEVQVYHPPSTKTQPP